MCEDRVKRTKHSRGITQDTSVVFHQYVRANHNTFIKAHESELMTNSTPRRWVVGVSQLAAWMLIILIKVLRSFPQSRW
jgi:hypothetical protein